MDPEEFDIAHATGIDFPLDLIVVGPGGGILKCGSVFGGGFGEEGCFWDGDKDEASEVFFGEDVEGLIAPGGAVLGGSAW